MNDIEKAMNGDKEALNRVFITQKDVMYKTAVILLHNPDDVYDAIQETLLKIYKNISSLKNSESFKSWSRRILINECYNIINKNKKIVEINKNAELEFEESVEDIYFDNENIEAIFSKIDEKSKLIATLFYIDELSVKEISSFLKIPEGTVKSRLSKAREQIFNVLKEDEKNGQ